MPVEGAHLKIEPVDAAAGTIRTDLPSKPLRPLSLYRNKAHILKDPALLAIAGIEHREEGDEGAVKEVPRTHDRQCKALPQREHLVAI